jgi:hypothetical protein
MGRRDSAEGSDETRMRAAGGVAVTTNNEAFSTRKGSKGDMSDAPEVTATTRKVEIMRGDWGSMWIGRLEILRAHALAPATARCQWRLLTGGGDQLATLRQEGWLAQRVKWRKPTGSRWRQVRSHAQVTDTHYNVANRGIPSSGLTGPSTASHRLDNP